MLRTCFYSHEDPSVAVTVVAGCEIYGHCITSAVPVPGFSVRVTKV